MSSIHRRIRFKRLSLKKMKIRVRFAPSPTGPLHIGGLRTALINYLYARKNNGVFILRVEDTDLNRYVKGSENYIRDALRWCGMTPDEGPETGGPKGPYRQSERKGIYKKHIDKLISSGAAYYAFDLPNELSDARLNAEKKGKTFRYCSKNRQKFKNSLTFDESETKKALEKDHVIRLKIEPGKEVRVFDEIRGYISVSTNLLDDKILMKSDGMPTYHFANVVDDKLMKISTVIRGEEWLPSLPLHKLIYEAFGWETPKFMHLPLILKPKGKGKLSKRDGYEEGYPVFPLQWNENTFGFREMGFLAEAMINYLSLLGWNRGNDEELFSLKELEKIFNAKGIQKGGARFDYEKALWINHQHIARTNTKSLLAYNEIKMALKKFDQEKHLKIIELVKDRLYTLKDLKKEISFLEKPFPYDEKSVSKLMKKDPIRAINKIITLLNSDLDLSELKQALSDWSNDKGVALSVIMQSLRLSLIGRLYGPDLFAVCAILGKDVSLKRVKDFKNYLS